jgi:hypothetical protein
MVLQLLIHAVIFALNLQNGNKSLVDFTEDVGT